jgi:hypothetical protein
MTPDTAPITTDCSVSAMATCLPVDSEVPAG